MIAIYADENVEAQIVRGLRLRGVDIITVEEDDRKTLPDTAVLDRATSMGRVTFTRDDDFLCEAVGRQRSGEEFGGVIYAHKSAVSVGQCIADLEFLAVVGEIADFVNTVYFLPI